MEITKNFPDEYEKYRFVPLDGSESDLRTLEVLAEDSRVSVVDNRAFPDLYRKYGDKNVLQKTFNEQIGFVDGVEDIRMKIEEVASEVGGVVVDGNLIVMDKKGPNESLRAYNWPFTGVRGGEMKIDLSKDEIEKIKVELEAKGIEMRRVESIKLDPKNRGDRNHIVAVFLGKE